MNNTLSQFLSLYYKETRGITNYLVKLIVTMCMLIHMLIYLPNNFDCAWFLDSVGRPLQLLSVYYSINVFIFIVAQFLLVQLHNHAKELTVTV